MSGQHASISGLASGLDTATIIDQLMQLEAVPQTRLKTAGRHASSGGHRAADPQHQGRRAGDQGRRPGQGRPPGHPSTATLLRHRRRGHRHDRRRRRRQLLGHRRPAPPRTHQLGLRRPRPPSTPSVTGAERPGHGSTASTARPIDLDHRRRHPPGLVAAINASTDATGAAGHHGQGRRRQVPPAASSRPRPAPPATSRSPTPRRHRPARRRHRPRRHATPRSTSGDAITVTSTTNTFTDFVPGVNLTLAPAPPSAPRSTVTRRAATATPSRARQGAWSTSLNTLLTDIDTLTHGRATTTKAGGRSPATRPLRNAARPAARTRVYSADGTSRSPTSASRLDRNGKLVFDEAKFNAAYAADPAGVAAKFTTATAEAASPTGSPTVAKRASDTDRRHHHDRHHRPQRRSIDRLEDSIDAWDMRLELRRTTLTRQFTALETALGQMNSQSNWLAGQISACPPALGKLRKAPHDVLERRERLHGNSVVHREPRRAARHALRPPGARRPARARGAAGRQPRRGARTSWCTPRRSSSSCAAPAGRRRGTAAAGWRRSTTGCTTSWSGPTSARTRPSPRAAVDRREPRRHLAQRRAQRAATA